MDNSALNIIKAVGYKNIFNYLYSHNYKDSTSFNDIQQLDSKYRRFFDYLIIECPEQSLEIIADCGDHKEPTEIAALLFLDLYSSISND